MMIEWSPELHIHFSKMFNQTIFVFVLCLKRIAKHTTNWIVHLKIPKFVIFDIIKYTFSMNTKPVKSLPFNSISILRQKYEIKNIY